LARNPKKHELTGKNLIAKTGKLKKITKSEKICNFANFGPILTLFGSKQLKIWPGI